MKALILVAGRGKRLKRYTKSFNKCMLKIKNKRLIEYSLDNASNLNINEILIVVGYKSQEIIQTYGYFFKGKKLRYIKQITQKGLVNAIEISKKYLKGEDFVLFLGDEVFPNLKINSNIKNFHKKKLFVSCGVVNVKVVNHIKKTYSIILGKNKKIIRLIEKPRKPLNNLMGTGVCIFNNKIFDKINYTPIHYLRKEKELPDLIQTAIDDGEEVEYFEIKSPYVNVNTPKDIKYVKGLV